MGKCVTVPCVTLDCATCFCGFAIGGKRVFISNGNGDWLAAGSDAAFTFYS